MRLSDLARSVREVARVVLPSRQRSRRRPVPAPSAHGSGNPGGVREFPSTPGAAPQLRYQPERDGEPDPGEVVWGWVPYEEDPNRGKDRPMLIVGRVGRDFLAVQLTSRDRAEPGALRMDHDGRTWFDVGTGGWDRQQRPSEARLDRLLVVSESAVRREGAALAKDRFDQVVTALHSVHGW